MKEFLSAQGIKVIWEREKRFNPKLPTTPIACISPEWNDDNCSKNRCFHYYKNYIALQNAIK